MTARLRHCPECGGVWPPGTDYALRGCGWLGGLPRRISPNNSDVRIHDGIGGRNRFLNLELKGPHEPWPLQPGQLRDLSALASQSNWIVRVLRGTTRQVDVYPVSAEGLGAQPIRTHAEAFRRAVAQWLNGSSWRVAESGLNLPLDHQGHVCGWAREDGEWRCVQDYHAVGIAPETSCGARMDSTGTKPLPRRLTPEEVFTVP